MAARPTGLALAVVALLLSSALAQPAPDPRVRTVWDNAQDGAMVSPDGKLVAFVDWNVSEVAVRDVATGAERHLPDAGSAGFPEPYFTFSPDSDRLVFPFGNNRGGDPYHYELRSIDLATGAHSVLATFDAEVALVAPLAWHSSSGLVFNKLAADGSSELLMLDPETKQIRRVARPADAGQVWQAVFTRNGRSLVILARDTLSWIEIDSGATRPLNLTAQILLGLAGDDRAVIFHGTRGAVTGNWSVAMSNGMPVAEPALIQSTPPGVRWAGQSRDGVYYLEPRQLPGLFVADIDPAGRRPVSAPQSILPSPGLAPGHPAWSRDGSRLAYTLAISNRNENRVFVADGLRGPGREIARLDLRVTSLDWSADSRHVIVGGRAATRDASWVGRIDASTGAIDKLVTGAPASAVAAGAGGDVVFSRAALAGSRDVHVMHVGGPGSTPRVLAAYTINDLPRSLSVSPDGKWVAMLKSLPETRSSALMLLPIGGGDPRTVLRLQRPDGLELNQGTVPWTADGRNVLVMMRRQGRRYLASVRVESGAITELPFVPTQGDRRHFALHPDGRRLVYVDGATRDELKVIPEIK